MQIENAIPNPIFAHHETFHLKYGWLKKGYDNLKIYADLFYRDDATVLLGVGKNMVRSIKFWGSASKMFTFSNTQKPLRKYPMPSKLGNIILDNNGLDPYLENPDTLWLIHWMFLKKPCSLPVWWIIFNEIDAINISLEDISDFVQKRVTEISGWKHPSPKSIKKDIDVFLHTYASKQGKQKLDDYIDCPFRNLQIIHNIDKNIRFVYGNKSGLSAEMVTFACLDFMDDTAKSISVRRFTTECGSVGRTFKLNEHDIVESLQKVCKKHKEIAIQNVNGAYHFTFTGNLEKIKMKILYSIYDKPYIKEIKMGMKT